MMKTILLILAFLAVGFAGGYFARDRQQAFQEAASGEVATKIAADALAKNDVVAAAVAACNAITNAPDGYAAYELLGDIGRAPSGAVELYEAASRKVDASPRRVALSPLTPEQKRFEAERIKKKIADMQEKRSE